MTKLFSITLKERSFSHVTFGAFDGIIKNTMTKAKKLREGWPDQMLPKFRHCLNGGGGSDPCLDFCEGFVHMH